MLTGSRTVFLSGSPSLHGQCHVCFVVGSEGILGIDQRLIRVCCMKCTNWLSLHCIDHYWFISHKIINYISWNSLSGYYGWQRWYPILHTMLSQLYAGKSKYGNQSDWTRGAGRRIVFHIKFCLLYNFCSFSCIWRIMTFLISHVHVDQMYEYDFICILNMYTSLTDGLF